MASAYEEVERPAYVSLAGLTSGQAVYLHERACRGYGDVRLRHQARHHTIGDFVMINIHDDPNSPAAQLMGMVY